MKRLIFISLLLILVTNPLVAADVIRFNNDFQRQKIGNRVMFFEDDSKSLDIKKIMTTKFEKSDALVPNFGFTKSNVWVNFSILNDSDEDAIYVELMAPLIDEATLYVIKDGKVSFERKLGQTVSFDKRNVKHTGYIFDVPIKKGDQCEFFLKIRSHDQIELPLTISSPKESYSAATSHNFFIGIYTGIMLIMILYNLFLYFSVRDKGYLYYVIYILSVLLTQTTFLGYSFRYGWPSAPKFEVLSIHLMSIFVGYASVSFIRNFLSTKKYVPKLDKVFIVSYFLYGIATVLTLAGFYTEAWILILAIVSPLSMFMLVVAFKIAKKGYRPAKFFAISWSIFLVGVFIYAMKDFGILPYNGFTVYTMPVGSAIETVLLSIALADRINILKAENEVAQQRTIEVMQENERIIKEQNVVLESRVLERTAELEQTNEELYVTLENLKSTQTQLVNAEKMASLGQLTAGIAHEINNPINFVTSNVKPLRRDIEDMVKILSEYSQIRQNGASQDELDRIGELEKDLDLNFLKEEMEMLLEGIDEGAARTAEIIKGLRNFSRLDEGDLKKADLNEGIDSTLVILSSSFKNDNVKIKKDLNQLPEIECYPGKLNQLFMNIINNAVQATETNLEEGKERIVSVKTGIQDDYVLIEIRDNGKGMNAATKAKVFDPFFTTKEVGQGTGLGLSIAYNIIEIHAGKIEIESAPGEGAKFQIFIPIERNLKEEISEN